jgi:hypothetical protein
VSDHRTATPGVLRAAYHVFGAVVTALDDESSWLPTGCAGWSVRDLVLHCLGDVRRGLVALHTPADRDPDRDAVTYWRDWRPDDAGAAAGRRIVRIVASTFDGVEQLREVYLETAAAALNAAERPAPGARVATQGHVLTAGDVMRTLAVEPTIHHLDLTVSLDGAPAPSSEGLTVVRETSTDCSAARLRCTGTTRATSAWRPAGPRSPTPSASSRARTRPASRCPGDHRGVGCRISGYSPRYVRLASALALSTPRGRGIATRRSVAHPSGRTTPRTRRADEALPSSIRCHPDARTGHRARGRCLRAGPAPQFLEGGP